MTGFYDTIANLNRLTAQQVQILNSISAAVNSVHQTLKSARPNGGNPGPGPNRSSASGFAGLSRTIGQVAAGFAVVGATVGTVTAALSAVPAAVAGIVAASKRFVAALSPSTVNQYEQQLRNLKATIGYALLPVITYATQALRDWGGLLLPAVQKLRPVFDRLSRAMSGLLFGAVRGLGHLLELTAKTLSVFMNTIESVIETFGGLVELVSAAYDVLSQFANGNKSAITAVEGFAYVVRRVLISLISVNSKLLALLGGGDIVGRLRGSIEDSIAARKRPQGGLVAAPTDAGVGSIEDVLKRMNERAYNATNGGRSGKTATDFLEEIAATLKEAESKDLKQTIVEAIREAGSSALTNTLTNRKGDVSVLGPGRQIAGAFGSLYRAGTDFLFGD